MTRRTAHDERWTRNAGGIVSRAPGALRTSWFQWRGCNYGAMGGGGGEGKVDREEEKRAP